MSAPTRLTRSERVPREGAAGEYPADTSGQERQCLKKRACDLQARSQQAGMMTMKIPAVAALLLFLAHPSAAQDPTFDLHVHLRNGAESIDDYEAQVASAHRQITTFGGMWFGGPNHALNGDVAPTPAPTPPL